MEDTFTQLPIRLDPASKAINSSATVKGLDDELQTLNGLHRALLALDTPIPPPPVPVNPKRSAQVNKLRESGNVSYKKGQHDEAVRMYTFGIDMASGRPHWEPAGLTREELSALYANRAQAHMAMSNWPEGMIDAECSVQMKTVGNAKAWWRKGRCLFEMGRFQEGKDWVARALEFESSDPDLIGLLKEMETALAKKNEK